LNPPQTLDLFSDMCRQHSWPFVRLDGTTSVKKRQKLVDQLGDRTRDTFIFLLRFEFAMFRCHVLSVTNAREKICFRL
jgi:SNF2 family DNA or RNA helicase